MDAIFGAGRCRVVVKKLDVMGRDELLWKVLDGIVLPRG